MLSPDDIEGERNEKEEKGKGEEDEYKEKEEGGIEVRGQKGDVGRLEWIVESVRVDCGECWSGCGVLDRIVGVVVHACTQTL